jgi:hypothetical protein
LWPTGSQEESNPTAPCRSDRPRNGSPLCSSCQVSLPRDRTPFGAVQEHRSLADGATSWSARIPLPIPTPSGPVTDRRACRRPGRVRIPAPAWGQNLRASRAV